MNKTIFVTLALILSTPIIVTAATQFTQFAQATQANVTNPVVIIPLRSFGQQPLTFDSMIECHKYVNDNPELGLEKDGCQYVESSIP